LKAEKHIGKYCSIILKRLLILPLGLFFSSPSFSQTALTGVWQGKFMGLEFGLGQPKLVVEIYNFKDSLFSGITHLYYTDNKYEHYKMIGWYDKKNSLVVFREATTIAVNLGLYANCLGTYKMVLQKEKNNLFQYGYWVPNINGCTDTAKVWLQKKIPEIPEVPVTEKKAAPKKKPAPAAEKSLKEKITTPAAETAAGNPVTKTIPAIKTAPAIMPAKIAQRETDVQSLIEIARTEKDSIKVEVYDNGEIDGDSVSVYQEEIQRINKKMITAKPITFYVSLNKNINPIAHLRLVAESLGSIPPCTALMIVTTKSKRYEVRLSSNFNKNATVELFLKE
jgi:hypothetical protein